MQAVRTLGISPKVIASAITGIVVYAITKLGLQLDPVLEQAINVIAMVAAAVIAGPGDVVTEAAPELPEDEAVPGEPA